MKKCPSEMSVPTKLAEDDLLVRKISEASGHEDLAMEVQYPLEQHGS